MARKIVYRCFCGFVVDDEEEQFVATLTKHAFDDHNMTLTRDQALAMATPAAD